MAFAAFAVGHHLEIGAYHPECFVDYVSASAFYHNDAFAQLVFVGFAQALKSAAAFESEGYFTEEGHCEAFNVFAAAYFGVEHFGQIYSCRGDCKTDEQEHHHDFLRGWCNHAASCRRCDQA